jgi:hypothetical protein
MRRYWKDAPERAHLTPWDGFRARRQFLRSFGVTAGLRLGQIRDIVTREVEKETGVSTALVVQDENAALAAHMAQYKLRVVGDRTSSTWYGREEGRAAGRNATLDSPEVGESRDQIGS